MDGHIGGDDVDFGVALGEGEGYSCGFCGGGGGGKFVN